MSHRSLQIADQIAAALRDRQEVAAAVYEDRVIALSEDAQELPAVSVNIGDDDPPDADGALNLRTIDSLLLVTVTLHATASDTGALRAELMRLRRESHVAIMADRTQGLDFVVDTRYGGAAAPEINEDGGRLTGRLETRWLVHYRMNITDPA